MQLKYCGVLSNSLKHFYYLTLSKNFQKVTVFSHHHKRWINTSLSLKYSKENSFTAEVKDTKEDDLKANDKNSSTISNVKTSTMKKFLPKKGSKSASKQFEKSPVAEELVEKVSSELHTNNSEEKEKTKTDLISQLLNISKKLPAKENVSSVLSAESLFRGANIQKTVQRRKPFSSRDRLNLFNAKSDYDQPNEYERPEDKSLWSAFDWFHNLEEETKKLIENKPYPSNAYEEQIMLTNEGKLWKFPVDNEQGVSEEEIATPFQDHIFLESKLNEENWCPAKGPIRDFMVALTTSLSMNPYFTVQEKYEHIDWFKNYFKERASMMINLGLLPKDYLKTEAL